MKIAFFKPKFLRTGGVKKSDKGQTEARQRPDRGQTEPTQMPDRGQTEAMGPSRAEAKDGPRSNLDQAGPKAKPGPGPSQAQADVLPSSACPN